MFKRAVDQFYFKICLYFVFPLQLWQLLCFNVKLNMCRGIVFQNLLVGTWSPVYSDHKMFLIIQRWVENNIKFWIKHVQKHIDLEKRGGKNPKVYWNLRMIDKLNLCDIKPSGALPGCTEWNGHPSCFHRIMMNSGIILWILPLVPDCRIYWKTGKSGELSQSMLPWHCPQMKLLKFTG